MSDHPVTVRNIAKSVWPTRLVPTPPGQDWHAEVAGGGHHRGHVGRVTGEDHPHRLDRVHAHVAREQVSGVRVEPDLTTDHAA
jgi:hypothetical protein